MSDTASRLRSDAERIFRAGLESVDSLGLIERTCRLDGERLVIDGQQKTLTLDLRDFDRILVFGAGKASARLARGLETLLGERITDGLVVVKTGYVEQLQRIRLMEAGHPVPDERGVAAAHALLGLGRGTDERTLFLGLTSGGGSALLCAPAGAGEVGAAEAGKGLALSDKQEMTRLLLGSGASIGEINCVRKHLSAIKGGRLTAAYAPGRIVNLILSDVLGDDPASIASGITAADPTTYADALEVLERYKILEAVPKAVRSRLEAGAAGRAAETPKPGSTVFSRTDNVVLGSVRAAVLAAAARAGELGYRCLVLTARLEGEAREVAAFFAALAMDLRAASLPLAPPACIITGGETTVTLRGTGKGGRNQELALACLIRLAEQGGDLSGICLLSAGTDGGDGPTDAAGAFAGGETLERSVALGLVPRQYLSNNDSYSFFDAAGGLLRTGPTNTNVGDLQILLVAAP